MSRAGESKAGLRSIRWLRNRAHLRQSSAADFWPERRICALQIRHHSRHEQFRLRLLMLLTPLGILAAGTAWGEWGAKDFSDPQMRQQIAAASGNICASVPTAAGTGPAFLFVECAVSQYAPPFLRHPAFGYVMSAVFGSGLILGWSCLSPGCW